MLGLSRTLQIADCCCCLLSVRPGHGKAVTRCLQYKHNVTIENHDHPRYVKHVLGRIYVFFTSFGNGVRGKGASPKGLLQDVQIQFFTVGSSKIEVVELDFCDPGTTQNHGHPRYVKHVLGSIYVFFTF